MNEIQKTIVRKLLKLSYSTGFDSTYPLEPIAEDLGLQPNEIYDEDKGTGYLYLLGPYGNGMVTISSGGRQAGVAMETRDLLAHWSDFRG